MKQLFRFTILAVTCLFGLTSTVSAQITWEDSVNMFRDVDGDDVGDTDQTFVDTTGTGLVALNASGDTSGDQNPTVNGVQFTGTGMGTALVGVGGHSITVNGGVDNASAFKDGEFDGDGDIFHLLQGAIFEVESVTLGGLVIGNEYRIQVFTNDARESRSALFVTGFGNGSGTSTEPTGFSNLNNGPAGTMMIPDPEDPTMMIEVQIPPVFPETEVGDSIIGTFTAATTSLTFNVFGSTADPASFSTGVGPAQINGIQLRDVTGVIDVLKGDADLSGIVDFSDIPAFITVLQSGVFQAESDCDCSGVIDFSDIPAFILILQAG